MPLSLRAKTRNHPPKHTLFDVLDNIHHDRWNEVLPRPNGRRSPTCGYENPAFQAGLPALYFLPQVIDLRRREASTHPPCLKGRIYR
jgi:hypothetical protein